MKTLHHALLLGSLSAVTACAGNTSGSLTAVCQDLTTTVAAASPAWKGTVFTIVMENHSASEILGNAGAPFINKLAKEGAIAKGYHDSYVHPSEPNYLMMVAGQNFGILDDADPAAHHLDATSHLADQLELAGISWKTYQESMGAPCGLVSQGRYAAKHNPFVYFDDVNGWDGKTFQPSPRCNEHVVDYTQLDTDIAANALPRYVFITPNLDNDMHDGSIQLGDAWLQREVGKIQATDAYKNGGVLFLMWDEGSGNADDPAFIVASPNAKAGFVSTTAYDTSSYLKTVQRIYGLDVLPCGGPAAKVATAVSMDELFVVPMI